MNPFPGLRPFTQEEDYLFFGREEQTLELLQRLGINRFVAVVGTVALRVSTHRHVRRVANFVHACSHVPTRLFARVHTGSPDTPP